MTKRKISNRYLSFKILLLILPSVFIQISNICQRNLMRYGSIIE